MKIFYWPWEGWTDGSWNPAKPDTFKECFPINQTYWFFLVFFGRMTLFSEVQNYGSLRLYFQ